MAGIKDYSSTAGGNTSIGGISIAEGMLPSNINNAFRGLTADIREWFNDSQWVIYGDGDSAFTVSYASSTSFTITGADVTSFYHVGRRVKAIATTPGTIFGTISATTFSTNTTVTVTWDSGSLSNESVTIYVAALSKTNDSIPELVITNAKVATSAAIDATKIGGGAVSNTEFSYLDGVTSAIQTQINSKQATITGGATTIVSSDLTASRALIANSSGKVAVSNVTDTELGYVSGVTSAIQTQIDSKQPTITGSATTIDTESLTASRAVISNSSSKIAVSATTDTELGYLSGVTSAVQTQLGTKLTNSNNLSDVSSTSTARTNLGLGTIATQNANNVAVTGGTITGLGDPSSTSEAATKNYVDNLVAGLKTRIIARLASTANVVIASALENGDTIDGITLVTGDRILLKDQSTASQNGLYTVVASGAASRDTEYDTITELAGQLIVIQEGTSNADKIFLCTTDRSATLGSSTITFTRVEPTNSGTVTSVGLADAGSSEFTITNSPVTASGTINIAVNSIAATKIGTGAVSNTEFGYLDGVTSAIQTQIDTKAPTASPTFTTAVTLNATGELRLADTDSTHYVGFKSPATVTTNKVWVLPTADGSANQSIITDGSGNLSFATIATTLTYSSGTATGDNSTTAFTISSGRSVNDVLVFVNGFQLTPTTDYTISGTTLTFVTAPATSAEITYRYLPLGGAYTSANFTGNGSATTITIDAGRAVADILVVVNGLTLVPTDDYTISGTTLTFATAPANLAEITVRYLRLS
jgi:hypothetical protein